MKSSLGNDLIILEVDKEKMEEANKRIDLLDKVSETKIVGDTLQVTTANGSKTLSMVVESLIGNGNGNRIDINTISLKKPTLNDVFLFYTGSSLRDETADFGDRAKMFGRKKSMRMGMMRR